MRASLKAFCVALMVRWETSQSIETRMPWRGSVSCPHSKDRLAQVPRYQWVEAWVRACHHLNRRHRWRMPSHRTLNLNRMEVKAAVQQE